MSVGIPSSVNHGINRPARVDAGDGFDDGAVILLDGKPYKPKRDEQNPLGVLTGKKLKKKLETGKTAIVRVLNSNQMLTDIVEFTRQ